MAGLALHFIISLGISLFSIRANSATAQASVLKVFIDAGHGGKDDGAIGISKTKEKDLTLDLSLIIEGMLLERSHSKNIKISVQQSRRGDETKSLSKRVQEANDWNADIFLSIHGNSSTAPEARGFEIYFVNPEGNGKKRKPIILNEEGEKQNTLEPAVLTMLSEAEANSHVAASSELAESIFLNMSKQNFLIPRTVRQAPFSVLYGGLMPSVLIEVGFLTNARDMEFLRNKKTKHELASYIVDGVLQYLLQRRKKVG